MRSRGKRLRWSPDATRRRGPRGWSWEERSSQVISVTESTGLDALLSVEGEGAIQQGYHVSALDS